MVYLYWGNWVALIFSWLLFGVCMGVEIFGSKSTREDVFDRVAPYFLAVYMVMSSLLQTLTVLRDL